MAENFFGSTDTGMVRDNNEDTFIAQNLAAKYILAAVIDGVGGYDGGEVAAATTRETLIKQMSGFEGGVIPAMITAFKQANKAIAVKKLENAEMENMACVVTAALADIENNLFYYAHVGDTRLYLLRDGSLIKISNDHSFVGFLEDSGRLTETDAMNHPKRNEINKALGFTTQIDTDDDFVETGRSPFLPGDTLLLCSDGLTDLVNKQAITAIITQDISIKEKVTRLIDAANANGGKDNVTVVLVHNNKTPQNTGATKPVAVIKEKNKADTDVIPVDKDEAIESQPPPANRSGLIITLLLLCFFLSAASVWLFLQWKKEGLHAVPLKIIRQKNKKNPEEIRLQNAIENVKGDTLTLTDSIYKQAVIISDTLHIKKDTLYIRAIGNMVLRRDTAYTGPAIAIAQGCKMIILGNIKFEGFDIGVSVYNTALYLKNTRFSSCRLGVEKKYPLADKGMISAGFPAINIHTDTLKGNILKINGAK